MTSSLASDPLLAALLDSAPIGIAVLDLALRYCHINQLLADSNGHPVAYHLGRTPRDVLPDVGERLEAIMRDVMASGQARCNFEARAEVPPGSGHFRLWNASYHPYLQQGRIAGIVAMVEDVTHARDTERRLRQSEQHVRRVLDKLFTFVGVLAPDGTVLEVNRAPLEAAGISLDSVRGQKLWDTFWWSFSEEMRQLAHEVVATAASGETVRRDIRVRMLDDSRVTLDFMLAPLRDDSGEITHLVGSANDVSDRTRSENALRQSETHFRQVVEATPDALMMVDRHGVIRLVNGRMEELFGYTREELVGQGFEHLLPDSVRNQHQSLVKHFFASPSTRDMANRKPLFALRRDGSGFPCEIGLNPLEIDGQLLTLASITNVTARYQAQQAMEKALAEKTVLLGEVHHRVKNNLQVISSMLNLQARNAAAPVRVALVESQNHVKSMALIHQLLYERSDFSRVPLTTYLERLLMLLQHSFADNRKISVQFAPPPEEVFLELQQSIPLGLLVNEIVTNAFKHAFAGREQGTLRLQLQPGSPDNSLEVADDGVGLPAGVELGESRTLGFQLLPMLADQLQGRLTVHSQPQQGTRFVVHFPSLAAGETP
ncbi:PAS domain S-box protein [Vogesella sp. LIG4]|uniref:sensor histidine kinase n=1 Tax=Vogesella sp. LIG4 TaxID=1192162 RepID=UPI00081FB338|nr:PAS domain S-box protein [Vogesella sp. LIG4]SCK15928.1 PAS domain S-box-containing protein [Vogesella sp. LIG4]